jgi:plasmid stabilization system protein ParE
MHRITFSPEARLDLIEITDYLTRIATPRIARNYETPIRRAIDGLRNIPESGPPRREFGANTRILIVRPYLIFSEPQVGLRDVAILRILHGARDIDEKLIRGRAE